jgi:hypothetical protein
LTNCSKRTWVNSTDQAPANGLHFSCEGVGRSRATLADEDTTRGCAALTPSSAANAG